MKNVFFDILDDGSSRHPRSIWYHPEDSHMADVAVVFLGILFTIVVAMDDEVDGMLFDKP